MSKPSFNTDNIGWLTLAGIALLLLEITFFNSGVIFSIVISTVCIYYGRQRLHRTSGKVFYWIGWISLGISIVTSMTFKFLLLAIIIYFVIQYFKSKNNPNHINPIIKEESNVVNEEIVIKRKPLLENNFMGSNQTSEHVYDWNDINIQTGIGDTIIDISNTVLPKEEAVISLRNLIGNIQILVPYETEVSFHHTVIFGSTTIFEHHEPRAINQTLSFQTQAYPNAVQKVKIVTSMLVGDIEVKRV